MKILFYLILLSLPLSSCYSIYQPVTYKEREWQEISQNRITLISPSGKRTVIVVSEFGRIYSSSPSFYSGWKIVWENRLITPYTYYAYYYPFPKPFYPVFGPNSPQVREVTSPDRNSPRSSGTVSNPSVRRPDPQSKSRGHRTSTPSSSSPSSTRSQVTRSVPQSKSGVSTPVTRKRNR